MVVDTTLYETLGLDPSVDNQTIKKTFRKLALKYHPDRQHGKTPEEKAAAEEEFKKIQAAYDVLSDEEKRNLYDQYGEDGLRSGGFNSTDDIFSMFFGGGRRQPSGPRRGKTTQAPLPCSLEDLFNGKVFKKAISRKVLCRTCDGCGSKSKKNYTCKKCGGAGIVNRTIQQGFMIQQFQERCPDCAGAGISIPASDRCADCNGNRTKTEKHQFDVKVDPGMSHNDTIVFKAMGNEEPGILPGDIVFVVQESKHALFQREGGDLIFEKRISLAEAIGGVDFTVTGVDGRAVRVKSTPGVVICDHQIMKIPGEGMKVRGHPVKRGNLYVLFNIDYPKKLDAVKAASIAELLGGMKKNTKNGEVVDMVAADSEEVGSTPASILRDRASDEDNAQGPSCQTA